jgi:hypothetical protein
MGGVECWVWQPTCGAIRSRYCALRMHLTALRMHLTAFCYIQIHRAALNALCSIGHVFMLEVDTFWSAFVDHVNCPFCHLHEARAALNAGFSNPALLCLSPINMRRNTLTLLRPTNAPYRVMNAPYRVGQHLIHKQRRVN